MLSILSLIILLFDWLLWGYMFNLVSVQFGLHLAYFLGLSPLLITPPRVDGIMILGVPFGSTSFTSFFLQEVLVEDVWHANVFPRLGDVQVVLISFFDVLPKGLPFCFVFFPPFPSFQSKLIVSNSTFMGVFERLLGPSPLKWPKAPLVRW
jgi:hypothetical protein